LTGRGCMRKLMAVVALLCGMASAYAAEPPEIWCTGDNGPRLILSDPPVLVREGKPEKANPNAVILTTANWPPSLSSSMRAKFSGIKTTVAT
jgi:hypothetical protein